MRKLILLLAIFIILSLTVIYWPAYVEMPEKDGPGPLSVYISAQYTAPEYHSPLDYWKTHHTDMVNRGDLVQEDCLYCHVPEQSCNNCHGYVGANEIPK
jgi:hypothetical protein